MQIAVTYWSIIHTVQNVGDGCKPKNARWKNYHIPDAGDCEEVELAMTATIVS